MSNETTQAKWFWADDIDKVLEGDPTFTGYQATATVIDLRSEGDERIANLAGHAYCRASDVDEAIDLAIEAVASDEGERRTAEAAKGLGYFEIPVYQLAMRRLEDGLWDGRYAERHKAEVMDTDDIDIDMLINYDEQANA